MHMHACVCIIMYICHFSGMVDLDPYGGSTDEEGTSPKISPRVSSIESDGGDTEDEIQR